MSSYNMYVTSPRRSGVQSFVSNAATLSKMKYFLLAYHTFLILYVEHSLRGKTYLYMHSIYFKSFIYIIVNSAKIFYNLDLRVVSLYFHFIVWFNPFLSYWQAHMIEYMNASL